jgi:hypothetical protein
VINTCRTSVTHLNTLRRGGICFIWNTFCGLSFKPDIPFTLTELCFSHAAFTYPSVLSMDWMISFSLILGYESLKQSHFWTITITVVSLQESYTPCATPVHKLNESQDTFQTEYENIDRLFSGSSSQQVCVITNTHALPHIVTNYYLMQGAGSGGVESGQ